MKKINFLALCMVVLLSGCNNVTNSSSSSSLQSSTSVSESSQLSVENNQIDPADMQRPTSTNIGDYDYTDYAMQGKNPEFNESKWYRNDLKDIPLPDPFVLYANEKYYIYGTTDRTGSKTLDCYETEDFNNFKLYMNIDVQESDAWGNKTMFAPEVYCFDGIYYLYYSDISKTNNRRYINVMTSENPYGPFVEYQGEDFYGNTIDGLHDPIFKHNDSLGLDVLDQTLLIDDDGSIYMYYSVYDTGIMQYIVGFEMLDPVTPNWDTYKVLVRPGELSPNTTRTNILGWECYTSFKVAEGPFMIKSPINGLYYMTYSVNHYPNRYYTVCYAVSETPLGDYEKPFVKGEQWTNLLFGYAGPLGGTVFNQWEGFMSGTAHHCFFKIGDQYMIGYHAHKNRKDEKSGRMFGMDYLYFDEEGVPYCEGPTSSIQPLPEAISGFSNIATKAKVKSHNVEHAERINDNFITEHYNLNQEKDREVILNEGQSFIELDFDKEYTIGGISIYNSAFYDKYLSEISFINFYNDNVIYDAYFLDDYINEEKEFIFPGSAFVLDIEKEFKASKVIIGFETSSGAQLNEIKILGC